MNDTKSFESKKSLRVVITLGSDKFNEQGNNTITLEGFRTSISIDHAGGVQMSQLKARIYGVSQSAMNAITTLKWKFNYNIPNTIIVTAIDGSKETTVFMGNIIQAWGNYQGSPTVFLEVQAQSAFFARMRPMAPHSFKGVVAIADVMSILSKELGYNFENTNVDLKAKDLYLYGTGLDQAKALAQMARIDLIIDGDVLAIKKQGTPREVAVPIISAASGLIGYPTFDAQGVNFQTLYNPAIRFGGKFTLKTNIKQADGDFVVTSVAHQLDSEMPHGKWFSIVRGNPSGLAVTGR